LIDDECVLSGIIWLLSQEYFFAVKCHERKARSNDIKEGMASFWQMKCLALMLVLIVEWEKRPVINPFANAFR